ncbi:hypothetical protein MOE21_19410 [Bacillus atrophaeus]|uniref:hypothetical protein n=1 Tax=Bacillus atrophaeus TaxID=1452 RepID=UPI0022820952|nr:hypothetical protein [Bacillus atrophaeus]MCY8934728.1 hypothetical protein [Bacillus atrophaeus]
MYGKFIVNFTPAGQELVTIVFPLGVGGNCITGSAQVSASQLGGPLGGPGGVQTLDKVLLKDKSERKIFKIFLFYHPFFKIINVCKWQD